MQRTMKYSRLGASCLVSHLLKTKVRNIPWIKTTTAAVVFDNFKLQLVRGVR